MKIGANIVFIVTEMVKLLKAFQTKRPVDNRKGVFHPYIFHNARHAF